MSRSRLPVAIGVATLVFSLGMACGVATHTGNAASPEQLGTIPARPGNGNSSRAADFGSPLFDQIEQRRVLRVGTLADYPPIAAVDAKSGQQVGFENDLARDMAAAMGVKIQFVDVPFATLIAGLQGGKFDIIAAQMAIKSSRALAIDFTKPWEAVGDSVVVLKSSGIKSVADLNKSNRSIAVILGGVEEQTKTQFFPQAKAIAVNTEPEGFLNVMSRRADAYVTDNVSAAIFARQHPEVTVLFDGTKAPLLANFPSATGVPKGNLEFIHWIDDFMAKEIDSGRYTALWRKYVGGDPALSTLEMERGQF